MDILAPLRFGWRQLTTPGRSMWGYIGRAFAVAFVGNLLLIPLGMLATSGTGDTRSGPELNEPLLVLWLAIAIVGPILETAIQTLVIEFLRIFTQQRMAIALIVGALAGAVHAEANAVANGVSAGWGFFAMTIAYQVAMRFEWWRGPFVAAAIHSLFNSTFLLIFTLLGMRI